MYSDDTRYCERIISPAVRSRSSSPRVSSNDNHAVNSLAIDLQNSLMSWLSQAFIEHGRILGSTDRQVWGSTAPRFQKFVGPCPVRDFKIFIGRVRSEGSIFF